MFLTAQSPRISTLDFDKIYEDKPRLAAKLNKHWDRNHTCTPVHLLTSLRAVLEKELPELRCGYIKLHTEYWRILTKVRAGIKDSLIAKYGPKFPIDSDFQLPMMICSIFSDGRGLDGVTYDMLGQAAGMMEKEIKIFSRLDAEQKVLNQTSWRQIKALKMREEKGLDDKTPIVFYNSELGQSPEDGECICYVQIFGVIGRPFSH